jgi:hypothetical protein
MGNLLEHLTVLDYFAIHRPEPSKDAVDHEMERDKMANPHNDTYKPRRRGVAEIRADLRYAFASALLEAKQRAEKKD